MNKKLIAIAIAMAAPLAANAAGGVSGFADIGLGLTNDTTKPYTGLFANPSKAPNKNTFGANGEVDATGGTNDVTARMDLDVTAATGSAASSVNMEQAFFAWKASDMVTVIGGIFNNPIGLEGEDTTDLKTITHGQIFGIFDSQTALYSNNIAGAAIATKLGPVNTTVGILNDIGGAKEKNSVALVFSGEVMPGLSAKLGYVTQQCDVTKTDAVCAAVHTTPKLGVAGNVMDLSATYTMGGLSASLEYLKPAKFVASAWALNASYDITPSFDVAARYDNVSFNSADSGNRQASKSTTVAASYKAADNFKVRLETRTDNDSTNSYGTTQLQGIVTF